jgi:hypothetical protein
MLEKYFESRFTLKRLRSGPSGAWIDSFAESLHDDSYSWWTSRVIRETPGSLVSSAISGVLQLHDEMSAMS